MSARKDDTAKIPLDLLPFDALMAVGRVLAVGKSKYGAHNWRTSGGLAWSRLLGALLRHTFDWAMGQDLDPESGESHMAHAACCSLFLVSYVLGGLGVDDRLNSSKAVADTRHETDKQLVSQVNLPEWFSHLR